MIIIMTIILIPMILKEREGAVTQSVRERESNHSTQTHHTVHYTCKIIIITIQMMTMIIMKSLRRRRDELGT